MASNEASTQSTPLFANPFHIDDIMVFDDETIRRMLDQGGFGLTLENIACSVHTAPDQLVKRIIRMVPSCQRQHFLQLLQQHISPEEQQHAQQQVLDGLFWELTYWKTPTLYEELTQGEYLHPGIFQQLEPDICGKTILDAGAGSGRASFECVRYGAERVYAVEPSPGLLHMLEEKLRHQPQPPRIVPQQGRFDALPLKENSVDTTISCSAFTALPAQGGETGLAELQRVTRPGGKIVLIWPRPEDIDWLATHGFQHLILPLRQEMSVHFRSVFSALQCARRFYARNKAVTHYILKQQKPDIPFSVLGVNPPCDYCWLAV